MSQDLATKSVTIPTRHRKPWVLPAVGLVIVLGAGGAWMATHANNAPAAKPEDKKELVTQELAPVDFTTVATTDLRVTLPISGSLNALNQATVRAKVAGEVREMLVPEGIKVSRGQVVMRLDTADLRARLETQQAALDDARAKFSLAKKNHDNNLTLLQQKFISQNAFDTAQNSVEIAQAAVRSAESQVDIARRALEDASIHAPMDGVISKRLLLQGEKASPDTPLFSIVDLSQMVLEAQVPAADIPRIHEGQTVAFQVEGYGDRKFSGKVARINPATEAGSRAMTVYIAVTNKEGALRSGMFAKGEITLDRSEQVVVLPNSAIRTEEGKTIVYKIDAGKVVAQTVELGLKNESEGTVAIASGLVPGNKVLIVKLDGIKPGVQVKLPGDVATVKSPVVTPEKKV